MKFKLLNNNPLNKKTADCVVRSITEGLNKSWLEVYDALYLIGRERKEMMNTRECYEVYLKDYKMVTTKAQKGKRRLRVEDFNKGIYLLKIANHLTIVKNGVLKDIFDCRDKCVYRYWIIEGEVLIE